MCKNNAYTDFRADMCFLRDTCLGNAGIRVFNRSRYRNDHRYLPVQNRMDIHDFPKIRNFREPLCSIPNNLGADFNNCGYQLRCDLEEDKKHKYL